MHVSIIFLDLKKLEIAIFKSFKDINSSTINPIYWMISGLRYATIGLEENSNLISLVLCFGFSCLFTALATYFFKTGYKIKS